MLQKSRYLLIFLIPYHLYGESLKIGEKNVGMTDRIIRIVIGIILLAAFALKMVAAPWSYLVALIGLIALVTGAVGTCALYSILGMNTAGKKA
jgi:hypothetical protein